MQMAMPLFCQSSDMISKLNAIIKNFKVTKKFVIILVIVIWIQSTSILTKALTGILLNTYSNLKAVAVVENLQDIINNEKLLLRSVPIEIENLNGVYEIKQEQIKKLKSRAIHFEKTFGDITSQEIFSNMINGKVVFFRKIKPYLTLL